MTTVTQPFDEEDARAATDGQVDAVDADSVDGQDATDIGRSDADVQEQALAAKIVLGGL